MARRHLILLAQLKGEYTATREMRQHAPQYLKGFPGAAAFRAKLVRCESIAAYDDVFAELIATAEAGGDGRAMRSKVGKPTP